jgi:8-oxo-dGTP pyrophosphatase MutT (NUDIX family)
LSGALPTWLEAALRFDTGALAPFVCDDDRIGWVRADMSAELRAFRPGTFVEHAGAIHLDPRFETIAARTDAMAEALERLRRGGWITGWRDEHYAVYGESDDALKLTMERAAVRRFGVRGRASHLNGYTRTLDGYAFWIGERSATKQTDPGRLDNLVGGGIAAGSDPRATLIKECWEEAGIPAALAARATPAGTIRFACHDEEGVDANHVHAFDLELPPDFIPVNQDGEVARIDLVPVAKLRAMLAEPDRFTIDAALVTLACLERLGR